VISAINAVTLKPAQCALWLRPPKEKKNAFYRAFNRVYGWFEQIYVAIVRRFVRHIVATMVAFTVLIVLSAWWYTRVPTGFFPQEDQGYVFVAVQLPDAASQQRTQAVMRKIDTILVEMPGVADWITIGGLSLLDNSSASNAGTLFVTFDPWDARLKQGLTLDAMLNQMRMKFGPIEDAIIFPFAPPAVRGIGVSGGFQMQVEDRGDVGSNELQQVTQEIVGKASSQSGLAALNTTFRAGVPQIFVDVDRTKVKALNIPLGTVFATLQAYLGSAYVNDFNKFGRTYQVRVQAEPAFRAKPEDIERLEVRNLDGQMIPMSSIATVKRSFGPQIINRYNLYPSASINGQPAPGYSSGEALGLMEQIAADTLPANMGFEWTGMAYQERKVGSEAILVFVMAVLLVYLVLAAQYESWFSPMAVILVVPLGLLGAIAAVSLRGMDNNLYTQIGIVLIIALASKNAILIVEFARDLRAQGKSILDAAVDAARMRFRPILMTSFAFILGVLPLAIATGAGAGGQQALGTAVIGGMLASTILAVFFVPVFFVVFQRLGEWWSGPPPLRAEHASVALAEAGDHAPAVATSTPAGHGAG
jgi:HAE1 family hydrophobic/amphiphilic exporter-1